MYNSATSRKKAVIAFPPVLSKAPPELPYGTPVIVSGDVIGVKRPAGQGAILRIEIFKFRTESGEKRLTRKPYDFWYPDAEHLDVLRPGTAIKMKVRDLTVNTFMPIIEELRVQPGADTPTPSKWDQLLERLKKELAAKTSARLKLLK